jgi:Tol biopolymer transport system component
MTITRIILLRGTPDGTQIAFSSDQNSSHSIHNIYVMDSDGTNVIQLTNDDNENRQPAWSPDGTQIAFSNGGSTGKEIYVMDSDGTDKIQLTNNTGDNWTPAWSPDGTQIAFSSDRFGDIEILVMDSDGTNVNRLLQTGYGPSWSN